MPHLSKFPLFNHYILVCHIQIIFIHVWDWKVTKCGKPEEVSTWRSMQSTVCIGFPKRFLHPADLQISFWRTINWKTDIDTYAGFNFEPIHSNISVTLDTCGDCRLCNCQALSATWYNKMLFPLLMFRKKKGWHQLYKQGQKVRAARTVRPHPARLLTFHGDLHHHSPPGWRHTRSHTDLSQVKNSTLKLPIFNTLKVNTLNITWE